LADLVWLAIAVFLAIRFCCAFSILADLIWLAIAVVIASAILDTETVLGGQLASISGITGRLAIAEAEFGIVI
jgi:hypothetical protein